MVASIDEQAPRRHIRVVDYDPGWPEAFEREAAALRGILGDHVVAIHHIGSTAISNMPAKPIIDLMVVVRDIEAVDRHNDEMRARGYTPQGTFGIVGRRFFYRGPDWARTHHVHVYGLGHPRIASHLDFRDYVASHPDDAAAYARVKREAARVYSHDIEGYMAAKDNLIGGIDARALAWRRAWFVTHPDVVIDPAVPVPEWPLSARGRERMTRLLDAHWIGRVRAIYASTERKAMDGAEILARGLGIDYETREALGENDRSSTEYLPRDAFLLAAYQFLARPDESVQGWETARHAQGRIVAAVERILAADETRGDIVIVSHGGVGTLLYCHLLGEPIRQDLGPGAPNGGAYFSFDIETRAVLYGWRLIDEA